MKEGMPGWSLSGSGPSSTPAWRRSWRVPGSTGPRGGTSRRTWRSTPPLVLEVYDWLVAHTPAAPHRPEGAEYPVWVSFLREGTMLPGEGAVILELELDPELITRINVAKWGAFRPDCGASGGSGSRPSGDLPRTSPTARQKSGRQLKYFSGQTYRESPRHWTNSVSCGARAWISYRRAVSVSR